LSIQCQLPARLQWMMSINTWYAHFDIIPYL